MVKAQEDNVVNSGLIDAFVYNYIKSTVDKPLSKKFKSLVSNFPKTEDSKVFDSIKTHIINYKVPERIQCHTCSEFGHLSFSCPSKTTSHDTTAVDHDGDKNTSSTNWKKTARRIKCNVTSARNTDI
ncbi:unnamed protein product [Lepeophtheirus salmonis]|uniref:(salmon louse) hypothetical protein n=1 Tax=Lepeophtheirus salmonis TaxID=72036 RepID=A0A7R8HE60_LEPSM|nr:unnamed protein product [Lepeophtheirus salmonis]CAF3036513.1 unnamed protein product [Lepeophtheirus salmonis]